MGINPIRAVLFDSGDTLLEPVGRVWWPPPAMRTLLDRSASPVEPDGLSAALDRGRQFLDSHHHVETEAEEISHFMEYYAIVLGELGLDTSAETIERLARAQVFELVQTPFQDTRDALAELRQAGLSLGLVSNAWPSLERTYRMFDLRKFFDAFVISSKLGCLKPDPRIYRSAIEQLGVEPEAILFVDDDPDYVLAAKALGMRGAVMRRYGSDSSVDGTVANLAELKALVWKR